MQILYDIIENLTSHPAISGFEDMAFGGITEYISSLGIFDETGVTPVGSIYGIMRCGKPDSELVLCDAHLDTVGFIVTELCEGGFLKVAPIGKIAAKILPASVVDIYGKKTLRGIFASVPPHLQSAGDSEKKMNISDLSIDTGLPLDELKTLVRIGTPVGFPCVLQKLLGDNLAGASFDDRLCASVILRALMMINKQGLSFDIAFQFSGGEETGYKGATTTAHRLAPSKAIVIDVTHAYVPGAPEIREGTRAGNGTEICFSPQTNRAFTEFAIEKAKLSGLPYQLSASPGRTGTNSNAVQTSRGGVPTLLMSVPLKNMHTMSEIVDLNDALNTSKLLRAILISL